MQLQDYEGDKDEDEEKVLALQNALGHNIVLTRSAHLDQILIRPEYTSPKKPVKNMKNGELSAI